MELSREENVWVRSKWKKIRDSQMAADQADIEWRRINEEINAKHEAENKSRKASGRAPHTDLMVAEAKGASLPLGDALATGNWHSRNAERHIHDVELFLRLKELGIL
jgi:hypothetical protein